MTVKEAFAAKAEGKAVILKTPTVDRVEYRRILSVETAVKEPYAVLEDKCGHSVTYADLKYITVK